RDCVRTRCLLHCVLACCGTLGHVRHLPHLLVGQGPLALLRCWSAACYGYGVTARRHSRYREFAIHDRSLSVAAALEVRLGQSERNHAAFHRLAVVSHGSGDGYLLEAAA